MDAVVSGLGPAAAELLAAWSALPRRDCVPARRDFDPMKVANILPIIDLLERCGNDDWRFRLVGTELERRWNRRLTGLSVLEIVSPELAPPMRRELAEVVGRPVGSWSKRRVQFESGRFGTIETLRLPLRGSDGSISLILCCSGELPVRQPRSADCGHAIVTMLEQRFFDIGAGIGIDSVLPAAAATAA